MNYEKMTTEQKAEYIQTNLNPDVLLTVEGMFETAEEMHNSEEYKKIFAGYENCIERDQRLRAKYEFIKAFKVTGDHSSTIYGFSIYELFKLADGTRRLMQVEISSCLDGGCFKIASVTPEFIMINYSNIAKNPAGRKFVKEKDFIIA